MLRALTVLLLLLSATVAVAPRGVADGGQPAGGTRPPGAADGTDLSKAEDNPLLSAPLRPVMELRLKLYDELPQGDKNKAFDPLRNGAVVFLNPLMLTAEQIQKLAMETATFSVTSKNAWQASVAEVEPLKKYLDPALVAQLAQAGSGHLMALSALNSPKGPHSEVVLQRQLAKLGIPWQAIALGGSERRQCPTCSPLYHPQTPLVYGRAYDLSVAETAQMNKEIDAARKAAAAKGPKAQDRAEKRVRDQYEMYRSERNGRAKQDLELDIEGARKAMEKEAEPAPEPFTTPSSPCAGAGGKAAGSAGSAAGSAARSPAGTAAVPAAYTVRAAGPCGDEDGDPSAGSGSAAGSDTGSDATGLGSTLTSPGQADGGIDFSTLRLSYLADPGDGSGLQYSFSAGLDPLGGDNRQSTGAAAATESSDAFFVWLELDPSAFWVNLNPTEPDRIVDAKLGRTDAGRIMLQADLRMKKSIGALIHPDTALGKQFWDGMAGDCMSYRTWIVPGTAKVHQDGDKLYILDAPLNVEMETQYLKLRGTSAAASCPKQDKATQTHNEQLFHSLVLPKLKKEINTAPAYADLRRVYLARVAAEWYRELSSERETSYGSLVDRGDISPWTTATGWKPTDTFHDYVDSYTKGEFHVTHKTTEGDTVYTRTYVYGGVDLTKVPFQQVGGAGFRSDYAQLPASIGKSLDRPAADAGSRTVWLGAATPRQLAAGTTTQSGSGTGWVRPLIRALPELVLLVVVFGYWRRRRAAAAGPSAGRGGALRTAAARTVRGGRARRAARAGRAGQTARTAQTAQAAQAASRPATPGRNRPPDPKRPAPTPAAGPPPPSPTLRAPAPTWAESLPAAGEFTSAHLARVVAHLARPELGRFAPNDAMVTAVRTALAAGRALGEAEVNFLRHQLTESRLMDGGASPQDAYEQALRTHPAARNYSPEVIDNHPGLFNNAWRRAWGMAPR
ncbi:hypothetical protein [Actinacidiphila sp. bgisy145]|uniref:hypothetical protein n=1 Tax=Actinacidiphila sp. bgisy145 TaxID=3413792 RepID=UPI003EC03E9E